MKYVLPLTLLLTAPAFAGNIEAGLDDPEVTPPIVLQSGQIQRICFLYRSGEFIADPARCGSPDDKNSLNVPKFRVVRGEVEDRCIQCGETREQYQDRVKAARRIEIAK